jgi:mersacidin/lichenicidin family type 2 lantibiotic
MSINEIIRLWKADEDYQDKHALENPAGNELSEEELEEVVGGKGCTSTCPEPSTCDGGSI